MTAGCYLSVVLPTLGARERLSRSLPALCEALEELRSSLGGAGEAEIVVVDDSGEWRVGPLLPEVLSAHGEGDRRVPLRTVATERNLGFGPAVMRGAREARGEHLLILHDDVLVGAEAVGALLEVLTAAAEVFAVAPELSEPAPTEPSPIEAAPTESASTEPASTEPASTEPASTEPGPGAAPRRAPARVVRLEDSQVVVRPAARRAPVAHLGGAEVVDLEVLPSAAMLVRRGEFLDLGGFDRLFAPGPLEDVDLSLCARRRGRRLVQVVGAEAVRLDLGDGMGEVLPPAMARALEARNLLLLRWKHLSKRADAADHLVSLWRASLEAGLTGDREALEGVALAVERLGEMAESRATLTGAAPIEL